MKFARFFIDRPIFAAVLSILIFLIGRTAAWARARKGAIAPAPTTSSCDESSRER